MLDGSGVPSQTRVGGADILSGSYPDQSGATPEPATIHLPILVESDPLEYEYVCFV